MIRKFLIIASLALTALQASALYDVETTERLRVWAEFPDPIVADGQTVNYIKVYQHDDDDLDYTAFNMEFLLPEGFKVNLIKQGRDMVKDIFLTDRAHSTHSIACNIVDGIDLRIIADSSENALFYKDDVDGNPLDHLFTIGLIANESIESGEYEIKHFGIKFSHRNADARIPALDPNFYTVKIENPSKPAGIAEIDAEELDPDDCYDLQGRKVDPRKARGTIVVSHYRKYYVK